MANTARNFFTQVLDKDVDAFYSKLGLGRDVADSEANHYSQTIEQLSSTHSLQIPVEFQVAIPSDEPHMPEASNDAALEPVVLNEVVLQVSDRENAAASAKERRSPLPWVALLLACASAALGYAFWPETRLPVTSSPANADVNNQVALLEERDNAVQRQAAEDAARQKAEQEKKAAELAKAAQAKKAAEAKRAEQAKKAEQARLAEEAKRAEEIRRAAEAKKAEQAKLAAEAKRAEELQKAEQARLVAEAKQAEELRKAEQARLQVEAKRAEDARVAAEAKKAEQARQAAAVKKSNETSSAAAPAIVLPELASPSLAALSGSSMGMLITQSDLLDFADGFSLAFEIGDQRALRAFFSEKLLTSDAARIGKLEKLFVSDALPSNDRKLQLSNMQWNIAAGSANGVGRFHASIVKDGKPIEVAGRINVQLDGNEGRLLITQFSYDVL